MARGEQAHAAGLMQARTALRSAALSVVGFSFFLNLLFFAVPLYMLQVYDRVLSSRNETTLVMLTVLALGALALYGVLELIRSRILVRMGARLDRILAAQTFDAGLRQAIRDPGWAHAQVIRDLDTLRDFVGSTGLVALCDAPWVPLFLLLMFLFDPLLGLVAVVAALVIFALALANELTTRKPLSDASALAGLSGTFSESCIRNARTAASMGMMGNLGHHWLMQHAGVVARQAQASDRAGTILAASKAVRLGFQVAIIGIGAFLVLDNALSPGTMIAASILMARALAPVEMAVGQWRAFVQARTAYGRLNRTLTVGAVADSMPLPAPDGSLEVERAVVAPPGGRTPVVRGASFRVEAGESLGIIGPSGAGKSSLARAILGVWPLLAGSVRLDGAQVWDWDSEELGPYLGYMPQEVDLFEGTVAENIARFGEIDHKAVVEAATLAGAHDTVLALPDGYDTPVGVGGQGLSGGQRQAIALARAVYGDVRLVVLDEPGANLDSEGQRRTLATIDALKARGVTSIVISHQPRMLQSADRVILMREGTVSLAGTPQEVLPKVMGRRPAAATLAPVGAAERDDRPAAPDGDRSAGGVVETDASDAAKDDAQDEAEHDTQGDGQDKTRADAPRWEGE